MHNSGGLSWHKLPATGNQIGVSPIASTCNDNELRSKQPLFVICKWICFDFCRIYKYFAIVVLFTRNTINRQTIADDNVDGVVNVVTVSIENRLFVNRNVFTMNANDRREYLHLLWLFAILFASIREHFVATNRNVVFIIKTGWEQTKLHNSCASFPKRLNRIAVETSRWIISNAEGAIEIWKVRIGFGECVCETTMTHIHESEWLSTALNSAHYFFANEIISASRTQSSQRVIRDDSSHNFDAN